MVRMIISHLKFPACLQTPEMVSAYNAIVMVMRSMAGLPYVHILLHFSVVCLFIQNICLLNGFLTVHIYYLYEISLYLIFI